jgi:subtilisin family serine protease
MALTKPTFGPYRRTLSQTTLIVKIATSVDQHIVAESPTPAAGTRAFRMPEQIEAPFEDMQRRGLLREVVPIHARSSLPLLRPVGSAIAANAITRSLRDVDDEDLRGVNLVRLTPGADIEDASRSLAQAGGVASVYRVPLRWLCGATNATDPLVNKQWALRVIRWFEIEKSRDARDVNVAVLDTGVDITHPDLPPDLRYTTNGSLAEDTVGHGTHVAGIVAALTNNATGIAGACRCKLHVWKIFRDQPSADGEYYVDEIMYQRALNAVRRAAEKKGEGRWVMNLGIGGAHFNPIEALLMAKLLDAGVVVCAAMGNEFESGNPIEYPGAHPGVLTVGAVDEGGRRAPFSNTGEHIDLCAPGVNILSTLPLMPSSFREVADTKYAAWSGTSMATPHVTGAAAILLGKHPALSPAQVAQHLKATTTTLDDMRGDTFTPEVGTGLLNLARMLA